jgi:hypothetical protein
MGTGALETLTFLFWFCWVYFLGVGICGKKVDEQPVTRETVDVCVVKVGQRKSWKPLKHHVSLDNHRTVA